MRDTVRVDGSSGIVAALLRRGIRSPYTVACSLCMSSTSAPYCRRPVASMSCTYLMSNIRCVWPITYVINALFVPRARRGHDGPDVRSLGNARVCSGGESHWARGGSEALPHQEAGLEPQDTWRYRSPTGRWSWCLGHVATPEPSYAGGGPGATRHVVTLEPSLARGQARCLRACGNTGALSWQVVCMVPRGMWRHQSPFLTGDTLCAMGHVATPKPFFDG
jgi:hypothetical protein